jgi:hypothetical protein
VGDIEASFFLRMVVVLDPPVRTPNLATPSPRSVTGSKRIGGDFIHAITAWWLVSDDLPSAVKGIGVVEHVVAADSEDSN